MSLFANAKLKTAPAVNRILFEINEIEDLKAKYPRLSDRSAQVKQKIQEGNDKITEMFQNLPIGYTEELFVELTKLNKYKNLVDAGLASSLVQSKHNDISAQAIQLAYPNIVPNYNVHNLKYDAPISNPLLFQILKNKEVLNKLSNHQIKETFESAAYSKSPYDERIDFALIMLNSDFDKIIASCSISEILLKLVEQLKDVSNEVPNGKIFLKKNILENIINKLKDEKYSILLKEIISTYRSKSNSIYREAVTILLNMIIEEHKWRDCSDIELQNKFDILLDLKNSQNNFQIPFQRKLPKNDEGYEMALKIYQLYKYRLTAQQKRLAFSKSIELIPHKGMRFSTLALEMIRNSSGILKKNAFLIERALINSTQLVSGKLIHFGLAQEVLNIIKIDNITINYSTLEYIYIRVTNKLVSIWQAKLPDPGLLYFSQDIYNIMYNLNPTKSKSLAIYV